VFVFIQKGKQECWSLDYIYNGIPVLPPQLNVIIDNGNYFTTISNDIYPFNNGKECDECQEGINNINPPKNNFLVTIIKDETIILDITPPFYSYSSAYSFPVTAFNSLEGAQGGLTNQNINMNVKALTPNKPQCISLIVNGVTYMSQTIPITNLAIYPVQFNNVTVLSTDTLQIQIFPGVCN